MSAYLRPEFESAVKAEVRQMMRGDVPYVYTAAGTRALYSDSEKLCDEVFERSPKEHALETLRAMDEKDELFDLKQTEFRMVKQEILRILLLEIRLLFQRLASSSCC